MSRNSRRSDTLLATSPIKMSWLTRSKNLLQVNVHDPAVSRRDVLLCPRDRLMGGATGTEAKARLGERWVPTLLQQLQHCLLDEAIEHRRDAEGANAPGRLRYLHSPYRLRPVGAGKQLGLDLKPMVFEVKRQILDAHVVDAGRSPCLRRGKLLLRRTCASAFRTLSRSTMASIDGPTAAGFSVTGAAARASVPPGAVVRASPFPSDPKASSSWMFC